MEQIAKHVIFVGGVQGVGFRFTAEDVARDLVVTGWVRNMPDRRVEVVAEAGEAVLKDFLSRIEQYFGHYIQEVDIDWQESSGEFRDFGIRF